MLIELNDSAEARRLQLDGYSRTGNKAVEADVSDLNDVLDRDDVSVRKVSLSRQNGDREADIIDREIQQHNGKVEREYASQAYRATRDTPIKAKSRKLFKVSENEMTVYRDFKAVISGDYRLRSTTEDDLEAMKGELVEEIDGKIQSLEDKKAQIQGLTLADVFDG